MKIVNTTEGQKIEQLKKEDNFLSVMFDKVFLICKQNKNFTQTNIVVEQLDSEIELLGRKIKKQTKLLGEADSMKKDLTRKYKIIADENFDVRAKLLEMLGSEI